ncbi:MAG: hypothetical protein ACOVQK_11240 [Cyanobium sp.]
MANPATVWGRGRENGLPLGKSVEESRDVAWPGFPQDRETGEKGKFFHDPLPILPNQKPRQRLLITRFFVLFPGFPIPYYDGFLFQKKNLFSDRRGACGARPVALDPIV